MRSMYAAVTIAAMSIVTGCGPTADENAAAPPMANAGPGIAAELRGLLVGRFQEVSNPGFAWSFQYPHYRLQSKTGQPEEQGTFELFDRHRLLDQLGFANTGAVVVEVRTEPDAAPVPITIRPLWSGPGRLQGFQYLAMLDVPFPEGEGSRFFYSTAAPAGGTNPFVPRNLPEFLPRGPASNAERSEPAKTAPGELPDFLPRVNSNF